MLILYDFLCNISCPQLIYIFKTIESETVVNEHIKNIYNRGSSRFNSFSKYDFRGGY